MKRIKHILLLSALFLLVANFSYGQKGGGNIAPGNTVGCNIFVPNAFTPNGDNINERFTIKYNESCNINEFELKIFDRWGRLVYESESADPSIAWDGTFEGKELQQGVYMYNLFVRITPTSNLDSNVITRQGTVILIR